MCAEKKGTHWGSSLLVCEGENSNPWPLIANMLKKHLSVDNVSCSPLIIHLLKIYLLSTCYVPDMIVAASGECE